MNDHTSAPLTPYVLLVEDNPSDAQLTSVAWKDQQIQIPLYWVSSVEKMHELLFSKARKESNVLPRLILLDINLAPESGINLLVKLRANLPTKYIPIVMLTSSTNPKDIDEAYRRGANGYVAKSLDFDTFSDVIKTTVDFWCDVNIPPEL